MSSDPPADTEPLDPIKDERMGKQVEGPPSLVRSAYPCGPLVRLRRSAPGAAAVRLTKATLRAGATGTARWRRGPELIVVGAKRGGTTSLWRYLADHPGVLPTFPSAENIKGTYYFDEQWDRGEGWYRSHFPTTARRTWAAHVLGYDPVAVEASPYYLFHPLAPVRARQVVPDAIVVALLRDPVERAFSHWKERSNHTEHLGFAQALAAEPERTAGEESRLLGDPSATSFAHRHQTYVAQGRYAPMLERWFDAFGTDQVIVEAAETFYADPQVFLDRLTARLGLPRRGLGVVKPFNAEPSADMNPGVRRALTRYLSDDILAVEARLGRSMPWAR